MTSQVKLPSENILTVTARTGVVYVTQMENPALKTAITAPNSASFGVYPWDRTYLIEGAGDAVVAEYDDSSSGHVYTSPKAGPVLKQGANGLVGTFVCNGATPVTVNNTNVAISDAIIISLNTVGGTVGAVPAIKTITAATGFTVAGTASDTSTYNYAIIKNAA